MINLLVPRDKKIASDLLLIFAVFFTSRLLIYAMAWLISPDLAASDALCNYDCHWYLSIAESGYTQVAASNGQANWAFFPMFPLSVYGVTAITQLPNHAAALVLNNLLLLISSFALYCWQARKNKHETGLYGSLLLLLLPGSIYFSVPYTESLFLLLSLGAIVLARESCWLMAGVLGMLAAATRNLGVFLVFPLALLAMQQIGWRKLIAFDHEAGRALLGIMLIPAGLFAYMYFLDRHLGNPFAFKDVQIAWGRSIGNPFSKLLAGLLNFERPSVVYHAIGGLLGCVFVVWAWRAKYQAEALFLAICTLIPLSTSVDSMPRYVAVHYVIYLLLAEWLHNKPRAMNLALVAGAASLIFMSASWMLSRGYMI